MNVQARHLRRTRRGGYVLVVTLCLLVLATTVTVGVSRAALQHAAAARDACDGLQHRYGAASIRWALLDRSESILAQAEAKQHQSARQRPIVDSFGVACVRRHRLR